MNGDDIDSRTEEVDYPIDGVLDLHTFKPTDVKAVVLEYIQACRSAGIYDLRIIHGKGKGILREQVHQLLERHESVISYTLGGESGGGWGATIVRLKR